MKKWNAIPESRFLKLLYGCISACFLIAAVCMPDRSDMFTGLWKILSSPCKVSTNYFSVGGYAATFLNMGLVALVCTALYAGLKATANNVSTLAFILTLGFCSWGINLINIWPTMLGVGLYCLVKKEKLSANVNAMLFSTGIAPLISDLLLRYPAQEAVGFHLSGLVIALVVGAAIGFFLPAGLAFSPKVHKGFDLYSAALPVGMMAFFLHGVLYRTVLGYSATELGATGDLSVASRMTVNIFCCVLFLACIAVAFAMGCRPKDYYRLLTNPVPAGGFSAGYGNAVFLMNLGVYGLFILGYYNLIGASFNAVTFGVIFCMLACCNSGSHPGNVWPIMLGYVVAAFGCGWLSQLAGGSFSGAINAQAIAVGLCFANGLSPITDKYGWQFGFLAAIMHYLLVTSVPTLHGGFCLYNGGFTAALVCLILVPQLERFARTRAQRLEAKLPK